MTPFDILQTITRFVTLTGLCSEQSPAQTSAASTSSADNTAQNRQNLRRGILPTSTKRQAIEGKITTRNSMEKVGLGRGRIVVQFTI